jgi:predicted SAM-dependent methyltransferase
MKIQFGSGSHHFDGWLNTEIDTVDITKPLPFPDECADACFASHVVEHVTAPEAFRFFKECHRILKPNGVMRICVPSISRVREFMDQDYIGWVKAAGFGDGTPQGAVEHLITNHGHLTCWSEKVLAAAIWAAGFNVEHCELNQSKFDHLVGLERHGEVIGVRNNWIESIVCEGIKKL